MFFGPEIRVDRAITPILEEVDGFDRLILPINQPRTIY